MTFPETPLDLKVELELSGTWTDITTYVYSRDDVTISRGRTNDGSFTGPSEATLTLNNSDGRFSSRNPSGVYYGSIGRNTPIRISIPYGATYLRLQSSMNADGYISCPDASALGITGDIDVRIDLTLENWREAADLCGKYETTSDQRSWAFWLNADGTLSFRWSSDGTIANALTRTSTASLPVPGSGRQAVRATLDVNNGASGHDVAFYYADTIDGSWTQLGATVTTSGTTSIFDSTAEVQVGDVTDLTNIPSVGKVHEFKLLSGIAGTEVANPEFAIQTAGDTSFADTASSPNTWTIQGNAELSDRLYRFFGEVSSWPARWNPSGSDVYTPIHASGILRRLSSGASPLESTLYRGLTTLTSNRPVAYWPCEDAEGSKFIASGIGGPPMSIRGAVPNFGAYSEFDSSAPILTLNDAVLTGLVPAYTVTGDATVRFLLHVPTSVTGDQSILEVYCSGTVSKFVIRIDDSTGDLKVQAYDEEGSSIHDSGFVTFGIYDDMLRVALDLDQNGSNIDYDLSTLEPGASTGFTMGNTINSRTIGQITKVIANLGGGIDNGAVGHISVQPSITSIFDLGAQLAAYDTEPAGERFERLCSEESVPFRSIGQLSLSELMGPQTQGTLVDLFQECEAADSGMTYESRDVLGLGYRTCESLYNQEVAIALDYEASNVASPLDPTEDDLATRNDITANRKNGSSARATLEAGALSVLDPPNGVGRYDDSVTVNVQWDEQLPNVASWRVHLGTVDETRYPQISVNLANASVAATSLRLDVLEAEIGDRITITNPPAWLPPEDISQIILGYAERLNQFVHEVTFNCTPESPYQVGVYGTARYGPVDTVLNEALDTTETDIDIDTPTGPLWATSPDGNYDILIGGERMTVTAVSDATGTVQTLTVTRSVNGVVRSHASGVKVELFQPAIRAL